MKKPGIIRQRKKTMGRRMGNVMEQIRSGRGKPAKKKAARRKK